MKPLEIYLLVLFGVVALSWGAGSDSINNDLVNSKVQTTVDLTTHLPKITNSITLENGGKSSAKSFLFAVDPSISHSLSYIGAMTKVGDEEVKLTVTPTSVAGQDGKFYRIQLASSLEAGKEVTVDVESVYSHALKPYPASITQADKQLVRFIGNSYFYSPYKTNSVKSVVNCASNNIEFYTRNRPVNADDTAITYGPYENVQPFSEKEMVVHFENNTPFLTVTHLTRLIEVSHWGNVAVEETVDIRHTGAELKGSFSRYDYQRNQDGVSSVKNFKTVLPAAARDVYYRDEIGNISTSNLREMDEMVELELRPRFPLFGGWKTHYTVGYNVPSYQYLYNSGDEYALRMRFVDHVYDDQIIDQMKLIVILPEGARNPQFKAPFDVKLGDSELHFTYLDTIGRPVIMAYKDDLVEQHIQDFELSYTFPKYMLLQEPFLVVGAFYLLFVVVIIYVRLDFSITKDEAQESKLRVAGLIEQVQTIQDCRSALYQSYDDAINKFKSSKDVNSFTANRKKIDNDYKQMTQQITGLAAKLKAENSDVADKVHDLQKLDSSVKEQVNLEATNVEKLIGGRMKKEVYVEMEATIKNKKEEIYQKMEGLVSSL